MWLAENYEAGEGYIIRQSIGSWLVGASSIFLN